MSFYIYIPIPIDTRRKVIIVILIIIEAELVKPAIPTSPSHLSVNTADNAETGANTAITNTWRISNGKGRNL